MSGIYFHVPFCKTSCTYCDFYHTVDLRRMRELNKCMLEELEKRKFYLDGSSIDSIYFGGGTPSLLPVEAIDSFIRKVYTFFAVEDNVEITLEANPDDINKEYIIGLRKAGVNRISLGVQSFQDFVLHFMERRHDSLKSKEAIAVIQQEGIYNISIDLIYGSPGFTKEHLLQDLYILKCFNIPHFSAYLLTPEENTVLFQKLSDKEITMPDEEELYTQYVALCEFARGNGYRHYEISNFCREGYTARHNKGYWEGNTYCGIGPSAHSYNGFLRRWNVSSLYGYIRGIQQGTKYFEEEILTEKDRYNEYLLTALRTDDGVDIESIGRRFGKQYRNLFLKQITRYVNLGYAKEANGIYSLTEEGMFVSDGIISSLFQ